MRALSAIVASGLLTAAVMGTGCTGEADDGDEMDTTGYGTGADTTGTGSLGTGGAGVDTAGPGTDTTGLGVDTTTQDTGELAP
jgi:hypothetical protein